MSTQTVTSGFDTWASSSGPTTPHPRESALKLRADAGQGFLWFRSPAPAGTSITSATLTLTARGASTGSRAVEVYRIAESWKEGKLTWNNRPAVFPSTLVSTPIGTLADGDTVTIDVTSILQAWSGGGANYGIRVGTTATTTHQFYAFNSSRGPKLTVTWSDNPSQPSDLRPSEAVTGLALPHVTFTYEDLSGNTALAAVQAQVSATSSFASPLYDSGEVATTESGLDLSLIAAQRLPNPSFSTNTTGWTGSNATLARVTTPVSTGPGALSLTAVAAGNMYAYTAAFPVVPGQTYTADAVVRAASTVRSSFVRLRWYNAAGTEITTSSGTATNNTTAYAGRTVSQVAPVGAASVRVEVQFSSAALGEIHYVDNVTLVGGSSAWAGMSEDQTVFWRVRAKDGDGLWSVWSDVVSMTRKSKPSVAITNLGAGVAYDTSPPIIWSVTGGTQHRYRVLVDHVTDPERWVYDSGVIQSAENTLTIPSGLRDDRTYRVRVRVWDAQNREATPGDPTYREASATFYLDTDVAVAPPTDLTVTQEGATPYAIVEFKRSTTPDRFVIIRDDGIADVDASEIFVSGTTYRYRSHYARPNRTERYEVRAVVNNRTSRGNPSTTFATRVEGIWLVDRDRQISVTLWGNDEGTWSNDDDASVYAPINGTRVVRVVNGMRGLEGSLSGFLMEGFGKSFDEMEADLYRLKERPYQTVQLYAGDASFEALVGNIAVSPSEKTRSGQIVKRVTFDFWQVGDLPFDATL